MADFNRAKEVLTLNFPERVDSSILDQLAQETAEIYHTDRSLLDNVLLDLKSVEYIDPEGALSIICFCAALRKKNSNISFEVLYPSGKVVDYLAWIGFFGQLNNKVGLPKRQDLVHLENTMRIERSSRIKERKLSAIPTAILLPLESIPAAGTLTTANAYEEKCRHFVNHMSDTLGELFSSAHYNFSGWDEHDFLLSNSELFKNTFQHSNSWGLGMVHARPDFGTTVCFYDIGVGFRGSVGKDDARKSIEWAMVDGNSSKGGEDNDGHGLTIVQNFVRRRNGTIKIRSGDCLIEISRDKQIPSLVKRFPGVQISYFIPVQPK